jgi:hypothetical protein
MKNSFKTLIVTTFLFIAFANVGSAQLPVVEAAYYYDSNVYPESVANDPDVNSRETIFEITEVQLIEIKYQTERSALLLYLKGTDNEQLINFKLLYPIEQVKRKNLQISHYMAMGLAESDGQFFIITIVRDKDNKIIHFELSEPESQNKLVINELQFNERQTSF